MDSKTQREWLDEAILICNEPNVNLWGSTFPRMICVEHVQAAVRALVEAEERFDALTVAIWQEYDAKFMKELAISAPAQREK